MNQDYTLPQLRTRGYTEGMITEMLPRLSSPLSIAQLRNIGYSRNALIQKNVGFTAKELKEEGLIPRGIRYTTILVLNSLGNRTNGGTIAVLDDNDNTVTAETSVVMGFTTILNTVTTASIL
jgi:hypothetical protein